MKVTRVAQTDLSGPFDYDFDTKAWLLDGVMPVEPDVDDPDLLIEFAGRGCYVSWHKPNEKTRLNKDYVQSIIDKEHYSVLEHAYVTYRFEDVSRNMLLELERHRHLSFSVLSTRFVDASTARVIVPPAVRDWAHGDDFDGVSVPLDADDIENYNVIVQGLMTKGATRKEAREAARWYLPGNLATSGVVTGNLRTWREIIQKRYNVAADAEIREFAGLVLEDLRVYAPNIMADMPHEPFGS